MGRRSPSLGLALALVLVTQHSLSVATPQCRTGCHGASQTFKYAEGTTYKYDYEGKIDINLSSAEGQLTSTDVKAQVWLTQQADCIQVLQVKQLTISTNGKKIAAAIPDLSKPIKLNFHDGHIEDLICTEPGDTQVSLNIKRAIASAFQVNLKSNYETDVFGLCPTETTHSKEGSILTVDKTRHLNKCAYRENIKQDFLATTFNLNSEIKSSPILNGDYHSTAKIKNGILDSVTTTENYLYMPFSVGKNGAKAQVTSKLHLTGTGKEAAKTTANSPRSIIFENPHPVVSKKNNINAILNAVKETAKTIDDTVSEHTAREFVNLIKLFRVSGKNDLLQVYSHVKSGAGFADKAAAKKIFLDAILRAGNGDCVEVALELLKNKELSQGEEKLVYLGLSFVRHATEASIEAASQLLKAQPKLPREAYLGIGNLVGRFCREHSCEKIKAVEAITQDFISKLGDNKASNKEDENQMIYALKAISNFHHTSDNVLPKLTQLAQDKSQPSRLRVAALESYLADPCHDKLRTSALAILKDVQQDSEVRIRAYLALAQCPNAKIGNEIKSLIQKEPSYQVGGFIVSHIRNLRASANPDKELAKKHLGFINLPKSYPIDFRKWSYNGELSYSIDTIGLASSAETNIIYSESSFLPRTTSLNLTADLFGHTFNFLEIETRQENLDRLIEHYLGPRGVLRKSSLANLWNQHQKPLSQNLDKLVNEVNKKLRSRRDISRSEIDKIGQAVQIKTNELNKDVDLDLSVKAFGSELVFLNINDNHEQLTPDAIIKKIVDGLDKGLDKIKSFEETLRSNLLILDAEFAYPTSLGFPLKLAVEGSTSLQLKAKGAIDVPALLKRDKDTVLKVGLIPSASIELAGRMTLDAFIVENGLKVASTLYTSTGGDLTLELFNQGQGVDVKFGIPVKDSKIISANHEIVFTKREHEGKEEVTPLKFTQNKDFSVCFDHVEPFIGLDFCADMNGPNLSGKEVPILPFPLAGDAKFLVNIERKDNVKYHYRHVLNGDPNKFGGEVVLEVIGQDNKKKVSLALEGQLTPEKFIKANLISPIKSASAEARIVSTNTEKSLLVKLSHDNNEYLGKVGVGISGSPNKAVYKPIVQYKTPKGDQSLPYGVEGQIIVEKNGENVKYILDNVRLVASGGKVYSIKGNLGREGAAHFTDLTVGDGSSSASLKGRLQYNPNLVKFNAELQNSVNPQANVNIKGEFKRNQDQLDSSLQIIHGEDLSSKTNILTLTNSLKKRWKSDKDYEYGTKNKLTYPLVGLDAKFEFETTPKSVDYDLDIQYNEVKAGSELDLKYNVKENGVEYQSEFEIYGLDNKLELKSSRKIEGDFCKIANSLVVNGKKIEVNGKIKHHIKPQNIDVLADLTIVLPTHSTPFKLDTGLIYNPTELDAHQKLLSGSTPIIDAFLKANKNGNANGSIKVTIKNILNINGQVKAVKGVGSGNLLIDSLTLKRQVKLENKFTIQPPTTYNIELTLFTDFSNQKDQKIVLITNNKVGEADVDSKNVIDVLGYKTEVNLKGHNTGNVHNGKTNGELEVTLPNEQYFLGKLNRERTEKDGVLNGHLLLNLECRKVKNAPGKKLTFKGVAKNTNPRDHVFDLEYNLSVDDSNGKTLNGDLSYKSNKQGEGNHHELKSKLYGSLLPHPLETLVSGNCNKKVGNFDTRTTYGPKSLLAVKGSYDFAGEEKPLKGDINLELQTPSKLLKTLKVSGSASVTKPQTPTDSLLIDTSGSLYADDDGSNPEAIVDVSGSAKLKASDKEGSLEGNVKCGKRPPAAFNVGYKREEDKHISGKLSLDYEANSKIKSEFSLTRIAPHEYKLVAELDIPLESHQKNKLTIHTKRNDNSVKSELELVSDGKKWSLDSELVRSEVSPVVNLKLVHPEGKTSQLHLKGTKHSDKQLSFEIKILNEPTDFLYEQTAEYSFQNVDEFFIKTTVNSPKLNIIKRVAEIKTKPSAGGKQIEIDVKDNGKNLISGSTSYAVEDQGDKYSIRGSGTLKVKEENKSFNFKYDSQKLENEKNGEAGREITFNAGLGDQKVVTEFKITNKQFKVLWSNCEEKKQCTHVEVNSRITQNDLDHYNQILEINVDLRKLGFTHEMGFKGVVNRNGWLVDHTVDVHLQSQNNNKYQYSLYLHPKEAGVSLTTPKRQISLEAHVDYPKNLRSGGKASASIELYLDKKHQPAKKTSLKGWVDLSIQDKKLNGHVEFAHPGLQRPLSITTTTTKKGEGSKLEYTVSTDIDIFAQPNQKLNVQYKYIANIDPKTKTHVEESLKIHSSGLNIDINGASSLNIDHVNYASESKVILNYHVANSKYQNELSWKVSKKDSYLLLKYWNTVLINIQNKHTLTKELQKIESKMNSYTNEPLVSVLEIKNLNTVKFEIGYEKTPGKKLLLSSGLIPGQIADIRADIQDGKKTNLIHATVKLDEANFLKADYGLDSKAIEKLLGEVKKRGLDVIGGIKGITKEWSDDAGKEIAHFKEISKKATPNLKPLRDYYVAEGKKIKDEIASDESIKALGELLRTTFGALTQFVTKLFQDLSALVERIAHVLQDRFNKLVEAVNKELLPTIRKIAETILDSVRKDLEVLLESSLQILSKINQVLEKYQPQIKQLATLLGEISSDAGRFLLKSFEAAKEILQKQWEKLYHEVKALPIFEELKAQYDELIKNGLPNSDAILKGLKELIVNVKELLQVDNKEVNDLIDTILQYIEKKIKRESVDDLATIERIISKTISLITHLIKKISSDKTLAINDGDVTFSLGFLTKLPKLVAIRFSPLAHLLRDESEAYINFLLSLVTQPRKWFAPFPLEGMLGLGQHIFTFDGKYVFFPGKCNYLLARDAVDGNFTLAGTYNNGQLTAITLSDETDSVTLKKGGQIMFNSKPSELPIRKDNIAAYRDYAVVNLRTNGGILVTCVPDLTACTVKISGFYHGKVRGLLGNGNNEPYDDLTIPNGKIVTESADFGNSYKLPGCSQTVPASPAHKEHADKPQCAKMFSWESPLRLCYPFVKTEQYKEACNHGVEAGNKDIEHAIGTLYVSACWNRGIYVTLPAEQVKCNNDLTPREVGDKFSVKTPAKSADIVLIVDTAKTNEALYKELIQPVVQEVSKLLNSKGISDVEYHLITFGGENQWPSHVTVGGKLTFKGKPPNVKFTEEPAKEQLVTDNNKIVQFWNLLNSVKEDLKLALGENLGSKSFREAAKYPFRVGASKAIIVSRGTPCEVGRLELLQRLRTVLYDAEAKVNLFTPFKDLKVKDDKKTKDVIGFNSENVFTLSQGKKKPEGSFELLKDLEHDDYCSDFTTDNNGNVFVTDNFLNAKGDDRKQFVHVAAFNIVQQLVNTEQGFDCECRIVNPWEARNVCTESYSKDKSKKTKA